MEFDARQEAKETNSLVIGFFVDMMERETVYTHTYISVTVIYLSSKIIQTRTAHPGDVPVALENFFFSTAPVFFSHPLYHNFYTPIYSHIYKYIQ